MEIYRINYILNALNLNKYQKLAIMLFMLDDESEYWKSIFKNHSKKYGIDGHLFKQVIFGDFNIKEILKSKDDATVWYKTHLYRHSLLKGFKVFNIKVDKEV